MKLNLIAQISQVLARVPMLVYPAVLVANAMQASALMEDSKRNPGSSRSRLPMGVFVGGTTIYPLVWLGCRALMSRAQSQTGELAWSAAPLLFIGVLAALFTKIGSNE